MSTKLTNIRQLLTGKSSSGLSRSISPNILTQYAAILACCLGLNENKLMKTQFKINLWIKSHYSLLITPKSTRTLKLFDTKDCSCRGQKRNTANRDNWAALDKWQNCKESREEEGKKHFTVLKTLWKDHGLRFKLWVHTVTLCTVCDR